MDTSCSGKFVWILIQGCTEIKLKNIRISKKRGCKNNNYLIAMALDTANMEFFINRESSHNYFYCGISSNNLIKYEFILNIIAETCKYAKKNNAKGIQIYYTGHSELNTGNWIFNNGIITFKQIINIIINNWGNQFFDIFCDCDFSGNWTKQLYKYINKLRIVSVHAASFPEKTKKYAYNSPNNGGYFTLVISKRKADHQITNNKLNRCQAYIDHNNQYSMTYWTSNGPKKMRPVVRK